MSHVPLGQNLAVAALFLNKAWIVIEQKLSDSRTMAACEPSNLLEWNAVLIVSEDEGFFFGYQKGPT